MYQKSRSWFIQPVIVVVLLLLLTIGLAACSEPVEPQPDIKIGLIAPLTGNTVETGISTREAAELAVQEVNDAGGLVVGDTAYRITLLVADSQNITEVAMDVARRLIYQDNVVALIGPQWSSNAIPVADLADQAGVPMISPESTNPETTAGHSYIFRVSFTDDFQGSKIARFVYEDHEAQRAAVLYNISDTYSKGIAEIFEQEFTALGGQVVAFEHYTSDNNTDFTAQLRRIEQSDSDILFLPNYPEDVLIQGQQARQQGITATFIGSDAWTGSDFAHDAGFEGSFFSQQWYPERDNAQSQQFVAAYRQAYNKTPERTTDASTYDAFGLVFRAIQEQGSFERDAIRDGLADIETYDGVTGTISYNGSGDPMKSMVILQIKNGQTVFYKQIDA